MKNLSVIPLAVIFAVDVANACLPSRLFCSLRFVALPTRSCYKPVNNRILSLHMATNFDFQSNLRAIHRTRFFAHHPMRSYSQTSAKDGQETLTVFSPKYDPAFKSLFGTDKALARTRHFLNSIYFPEDHRIQNVELLPPLKPALPDEGRDIFFDVLCEDVEGKKFIIEMQKRHHKEFFRRLVFYSSRQLVDQWDHLSEKHRVNPSAAVVSYKDVDGKPYTTQAQYRDLCPVWTLAITDYRFTPPGKEEWNPLYASITWDYSPHTRATDMMRWCFLDLTRPLVIPEGKQSCQAKLLNPWFALFNITDHKVCKSKAVISYPLDDELTGGIEEVKSGYECLGRLPPETQAAIEAAVRHEADLNSVLAEEQEIGLQKGKEIGLQEGKGIGWRKRDEQAKKEKIEMVRKMLAKNRPIDEIIDFTGLSESEIKKLTT